MGLGIVTASNCFSEPVIQRSLPPEHRILGVKAGPHCTDYLIEGPLMPTAEPAENVSLLFTMNQRDNRFYLTGQVTYPRSPVSTSWAIGDWPSMAAYQKEIEYLNRKAEVAFIS